MFDVITFGVTLIFITLTAWLIYIKVDPLLKAYLIVDKEIHIYAEFGRLTSGLVHDIANPLVALSANIESLEDKVKSAELTEAKMSLKCIERYVGALRIQLQGKSDQQFFEVEQEIKRVVEVLGYKARHSGVVIQSNGDGVRLFGDPVKFNKVVANLIANAIDAYPASGTKPRVVMVATETKDQHLFIKITDSAGGVPISSRKTIFEPFCSARKQGCGIGIGLTMAKNYIENDFSGEIKLDYSQKGKTTFELKLPLSKLEIST